MRTLICYIQDAEPGQVVEQAQVLVGAEVEMGELYHFDVCHCLFENEHTQLRVSWLDNDDKVEVKLKRGLLGRRAAEWTALELAMTFVDRIPGATALVDDPQFVPPEGDEWVRITSDRLEIVRLDYDEELDHDFVDIENARLIRMR